MNRRGNWEMRSGENRSIRLIVNGKAANALELAAAVSAIRDRGVSLDVRVTGGAGDAARMAAEAGRDGVDVVVAVGGDGTVSEVASGLLTVPETCKTAVAVVPFGTANDFAAGCGIPIGDPLAALELAAAGDSTPIDVGRVNDRYFINVASGGFGARVTAETPPGLKELFGGAAYSLMGLVHATSLTPYRGRFITADAEHHGAIIAMAVGNGRCAGGGFQVTPRALLNDGLLDLMLIVDFEVLEFGVLISELFNLGAEENRCAVYRQLKSFRIESDEPMPMNLDGEPIVESTFDFEVLPRRLQFILPDGAPIVAPDRSE
jgi:lipid kinase YegS